MQGKAIDTAELDELRKIQQTIDVASVKLQSRIAEVLESHDALIRSSVICLECGTIRSNTMPRCLACIADPNPML